MRRAIIFLLLISSPCFAKHKPKPKAISFDHVGTMTYHAAHVKYLLEGRTDIFYDGEYECTPGDEHHAPDCRTFTDWNIITQKEFTEIFLDDGRRVILGGDETSWCTAERCQPTSKVLIVNPWNFPELPKEIIDETPLPPNISPDVARVLNEARHKNEHPLTTPPALLKDGGTVEFHYGFLEAGDIVVKPKSLKP